MNELGIYPSNNDTARRWMAERENASARLELLRRLCSSLGDSDSGARRRD